MGLYLPRRWRRQPQGPVIIDWSNGILDPATTKSVICPSAGRAWDVVQEIGLSSTSGVLPDPSFGDEADGIALQDTGLIAASAANLFLTGNETTYAIVRYLRTTTSSIYATHGFFQAVDKMCRVHFPYSDNVVYWDCGNFNTGSGRVSTSALTWTAGEVNTWVFVAGSASTPATRGREIWRDGQLLASDASAQATWSGATEPFVWGRFDGAGPDEVMLLGIACDEQWSVAKIEEWSYNPWQVVAPQVTRFYSFSAAAVTYNPAWGNSANTVIAGGAIAA